jgi:hypothetical protein
MHSTTTSQTSEIQASSTWNYPNTLTLVAFAIFTMSLLTAHITLQRKTTPSSTITGTVIHYLTRSNTPRHLSQSSGPLLAALQRRQPTLPNFSSTDSARLTRIDTATTLAAHIHTLSSTYSRNTYLGASTFSDPSTPSLYGRSKRLTSTMYLGLICQLLPSGHLAVRLHADDITAVTEAGWAVRSPSSRSYSDEVHLHAPRDEHDLEVLKGIIQAAMGYVGNDSIEEGEDGKDEDDRLVRPLWLLPKYAL